jgi:hypothetical protein
MEIKERKVYELRNGRDAFVHIVNDGVVHYEVLGGGNSVHTKTVAAFLYRLAR